VRATYLLKTERGRQLLQQAREKGQELWLKAREASSNASDALESSTTQSSLTPGELIEEPAT